MRENEQAGRILIPSKAFSMQENEPCKCYSRIDPGISYQVEMFVAIRSGLNQKYIYC